MRATWGSAWSEKYACWAESDSSEPKSHVKRRRFKLISRPRTVPKAASNSCVFEGSCTNMRACRGMCWMRKSNACRRTRSALSLSACDSAEPSSVISMASSAGASAASILGIRRARKLNAQRRTFGEVTTTFHMVWRKNGQPTDAAILSRSATTRSKHSLDSSSSPERSDRSKARVIGRKSNCSGK